MIQTFDPKSDQFTAFVGTRIVAEGTRQSVHTFLRESHETEALIFEDWSGKQTDFDLSQPFVEPPTYAGPGRPKLGVKAREVTLLPRHWDWLDNQRGGASARLRELVEKAMKENPTRERIRQAQDSCFRFLSAVAGNLPNYEEASRALTRKDQAAFKEQIETWPEDVRGYATFLAHDAFLNS